MPTPYRDTQNKQTSRLPMLVVWLASPLLITIISSLSNNHFRHFLVALGAVILYAISAYFIARSNYYASQLSQRKWSRPNSTPWKISAALFSAAATVLVAYFIVDNSIFISLGYGLLTFCGMALFYGFDAKDTSKHTQLSGVSAEELTDAFNEAEGKIDNIRTAARKLRSSNKVLAKRLVHIADNSQGILKIINDDPKDLRQARKFLKVYLDGTQSVVSKYAARDHLQDDDTIKSNLDKVLDTIESVIIEQRDKLLKNDMLDLDVQIEVLQTQLTHEGIQ